MKKEDIEKAAIDNIEFQGNLDLGTIIENACRESFVSGANWRINSVYHKASEEPESGEMALAICEGNNPVICGTYHYDWETTVENFNIIKWAYVKDLIPNTED